MKFSIYFSKKPSTHANHFRLKQKYIIKAIKYTKKF